MAKSETQEENNVTSISKKSKGSDWSVKRCKKFARRFSTEKDWQVGHQASYKAAASHNWLTECKKSLGENDKNLKSGKKAA